MLTGRTFTEDLNYVAHKVELLRLTLMLEDLPKLSSVAAISNPEKSYPCAKTFEFIKLSFAGYAMYVDVSERSTYYLTVTKVGYADVSKQTVFWKGVMV